MLLALLGAIAAVHTMLKHHVSKRSVQAKISLVYQGMVQVDEVEPATPPLFQFRLWHLAILVAACALFFGIRRSIDDQFSPENAPARGLRGLRSSDPATRAWGATELGFVFTINRPTTTP